MIRLVGIDVDGTLVGADGEVRQEIWRAAERARAAGIHLALCSGRPAFGLALDYARNLDPDGWHSFQNGASIVHFASARSLSSYLPQASVTSLIAQARSTNRVLELYADTEYVTESTSPWAHAHATLLGIAFNPNPFESLLKPIVRAQWLVASDEVQQVIEDAPPELEAAESSSPLMPDTRFVGLTRQGISKGSAMRSIAESYGIPLQQVMYVGDAGNDLSALRIVGYPVAMANADEAVLAAAARVVRHVDAAGLAEALELAIAG